jgi:hypothetical protein
MTLIEFLAIGTFIHTLLFQLKKKGTSKTIIIPPLLFFFIAIYIFGLLNSNPFDPKLLFHPNLYRNIIFCYFLYYSLSSNALSYNVAQRIILSWLAIATSYAAFRIFNFILGKGILVSNLGSIVMFEGDLLFHSLISVSFLFSLYIFRNSINPSKKISALFLFALLIHFSTIILSLRRTYYLGLLITLVIALIASPKKSLRIVIIMLTVFVLVISISIPFIPQDSIFSIDTLIKRATSIFTPNNDPHSNLTSDNGHIDDIYDAWNNVKQSPIFGNGILTAVKRTHVSWQENSTFIHNAYLMIWNQLGLPGIVLFIFVNIKVFIHFWKCRNSNPTYAIPACSIIGLIFTRSLTDGPFFYQISNAFVVTILLSLSNILIAMDPKK